MRKYLDETMIITNPNPGIPFLIPKILGTPIYFPKKHTVCSYRSQQRAAKKRRISKLKRK